MLAFVVRAARAAGASLAVRCHRDPGAFALARTARVAGAIAAMSLASCVAGGCDVLSHGGHYFKKHGIRMYYELHGRGAPMLLIHGGGGSGRDFSKQLPAFRPRHRCIVPDCCAQGRTSDRPGPLTYHAMAEDMIALLDHLKVARVDVMGWSDGGDIGLDMAMNHPDRVNHLVTFGANFQADGYEPEIVERNNAATSESFGRGAGAGWRRLNPQPDHYEEAMNKIVALWRTQPDWSLADLRRIRARTLVCAGDHDIIRPEHTADLAKAIPGAEMWIVPDASHGAMIERPDLVNARVLEFLRR